MIPDMNAFVLRIERGTVVNEEPEVPGHVPLDAVADPEAERGFFASDDQG